MRNQIKLLLALIVLTSSCERYETIDAEIPFKNSTVASVLIKSDSSMAVLMLNQTAPVNAIDTVFMPIYITNADVWLTYKNNRYPFVYDESSARYMVDIGNELFEPGQPCNLEVNTTNEKITGSVIMPQKAVISYEATAIPIIENGFYNYEVTVKYTLQSAGEANLLAIASLISTDSSETMLGTKGFYNEIIKLKQGQTVEQQFITYGVQLEDNAYRVKILPTLYDNAFTTYYNKLALGGFEVFGNPFVEPVISYSNLSNNIGILGASTSLNEQSVIIKK